MCHGLLRHCPPNIHSSMLGALIGMFTTGHQPMSQILNIEKLRRLLIFPMARCIGCLKMTIIMVIFGACAQAIKKELFRFRKLETEMELEWFNQLRVLWIIKMGRSLIISPD